MNPRLKSSKRWTHFPEEFADQIEKVFHDNFKSFLMDRKIKVDGRIYPSEIMLRVEVLESKQLGHLNFGASIDYSTKDKNVIESIHTCVDAVASMLADHIENDHTDFPRDWQEFPFDNKTIFLQFSTENSILEEKANELLGIKKDGILQGEELEDELIEKALEAAANEPDSEILEEDLEVALKNKVKGKLH